MQPVVFIARLVGPLFVVLGIGCLLNQTVYADMIGQAVLVPVLIYLSGLIGCSPGRHAQRLGRWTADWRVIITILGWILVIAGIIRIVLPATTAVSPSRSIPGGRDAIVGVVVLVIGGFLSFKGYRRVEHNNRAG